MVIQVTRSSIQAACAFTACVVRACVRASVTPRHAPLLPDWSRVTSQRKRNPPPLPRLPASAFRSAHSSARPSVGSPLPRELCMISGPLRSLFRKAHGVLLAMNPQVVFVLGGPGAGKGTQCAKIVENYSYTHLSAGDLLREERSRTGSDCGQLIDSYIKEGKIVPVEITINLLKKAMEETMKKDENKFRFLIDGFPRNEDNLQGWTRVMDGKADVKFVLFFNCGNEVCIERCLERGKSSGRTDDNKESLEKRIQTYLQSTRPIIEQYEKQGKVRTIDASRSVNEVFADVKSVFDREA